MPLNLHYYVDQQSLTIKYRKGRIKIILGMGTNLILIQGDVALLVRPRVHCGTPDVIVAWLH